MAELLFDHLLEPQCATFDKINYSTPEEALSALDKSSTIYVGNLDPQTSEHQIRDFFSIIGPVLNVIKGVNDINKEPLKFAFVEFLHREHALAAIKTLTGTRCFGEVIRCSLDSGYLPGRELGRAANGYARGQWVDKSANAHAQGGGGGGRFGGRGRHNNSSSSYNNNRNFNNNNNSNNNYNNSNSSNSNSNNNSNNSRSSSPRSPRPDDRGPIIPDGLLPPGRSTSSGDKVVTGEKRKDRNDELSRASSLQVTVPYNDA